VKIVRNLQIIARQEVQQPLLQPSTVSFDLEISGFFPDLDHKSEFEGLLLQKCGEVLYLSMKFCSGAEADQK